jgi:hypothetical protein
LREAPNTPLGPARSLSVGARRGGRRRPAVEIGRLVRETAQCPPFLPKKERVALHREPQRSRFVLAPPFAHCRTVQLIAYLNCDGSKAGGMVGDHKLAGRGNACVNAGQRSRGQMGTGLASILLPGQDKCSPMEGAICAIALCGGMERRVGSAECGPRAIQMAPSRWFGDQAARAFNDQSG